MYLCGFSLEVIAIAIYSMRPPLKPSAAGVRKLSLEENQESIASTREKVENQEE